MHTAERPTPDESALNGRDPDGPVPDGPVIGGPVPDGPAPDGPAPNGRAPSGSSLDALSGSGGPVQREGRG